MLLVTGGAGFIGSNLVMALQERDAVVVCDVYGNDDKWKNLRYACVDRFIQPEDIASFLNSHGRSISAVLHLGAVSATTERDVDLIVRSNLILSRLLWDFCTSRQIPFIYASSAATYGDGVLGFDDRADPEYLASLRPLNPYGWSKHAFDRQVLSIVARREAAPSRWAGLKFFNVYGPRERHKGSMRSIITSSYEALTTGASLRLFKSDRYDYTDGGQMRDFVFVDDCVRVMTWMLDNNFPSDLYNVGTGKAQTWLDAGHAMFAAIGQAPRIEFIEMPEHLRGKYQYYTEANMTKLAAIGAPVPQTSLVEGVAQTYRYMASELL
ncbi:MAG: ADP-glyceromanno-heptose 6-epimerase [Sphingomonadales bacterium]|nr:ADP-glyceromanno-heptose 6-epimerase [Sphingomonadales bacterium]